MSHNSIDVVFSGGGTGGHLFPGLAIAAYLRRHKPALKIAFTGIGKDFELRAVAEHNFEYVKVEAAPFALRPEKLFRCLAEQNNGYRTATRWIRRAEPGVVVGLGGYSSIPMARAAIRERIPLLLLEQNAVPGRATRWLAPKAEVVFLAFNSARHRLPASCRAMVIGTPVRSQFLSPIIQAIGNHQPGPKASRRLLVLGGSGGARSLNQVVPSILAEHGEPILNWSIVHQTGANELEETRALYRRQGIPAVVTAKLDNMPLAMACSDLILSRAGGSTLAEIAVMQKPSILVPYLHATDQHQLRNAEEFFHRGACRLIQESSDQAQFKTNLCKTIKELLGDQKKLSQMAQPAKEFAKPESSQQIASAIMERLKQPRHRAAA